MIPGTYALKIYQGDTFAMTVKLWADAAKTIPADLTGATAKAEIRNATSGGALQVAFACSIVTNVVTLKLTPTLTAGLKAQGVWDLQLTYADGTVSTILAGAVTVTGDVTDSVVMPAVRGARAS